MILCRSVAVWLHLHFLLTKRGGLKRQGVLKALPLKFEIRHGRHKCAHAIYLQRTLA